MKAIIFDGALRFVENHPEPELCSGEALVRPIYAGVCATDLEIIKGYMGFAGVLGHEFVGVVEFANDKNLMGRRVVGDINCSCGDCEYCTDGMGNHCPNRDVLGILKRNGVFAERFTLPESNLHLVPDSVSDTEAVFTEPLAAGFQILRQVDINRSTRTAVLGDGRLGLLVSQVIKTTGCELVAIGKHKARLDILKGMGIDTAFVKDVESRRKKFDVVVDATGSDTGFGLAVKLVKPRGTIVLKTTVASRGVFDLNSLVIDEITIIGSRCGPFDEALSAFENGSVNVKPLISSITPLEDAVSAITDARSSSEIKFLISMS